MLFAAVPREVGVDAGENVLRQFLVLLDLFGVVEYFCEDGEPELPDRFDLREFVLHGRAVHQVLQHRHK